MLYRPSQSTQKDSPSQHSTKPNLLKHSKYGLDIPTENLTHITSYLDPPSLLALSGVNTALHEHVKDEHTWHRAFVYSFLGIKPEDNLDDVKGLMLRRSESSWKKEFIIRYNLRRRWERSRSTTIAHIPLHSHISQMHLLPSNSLLSCSLRYGIVARSLPLTGKILRGYLSPSPSGTGLGIGNPNTEFSPNVSACAISSDGGTAKIAWGLRTGEVAIMTAVKVMDANTRSAAKLVRCHVEEEHDGEVLDAAWDTNGAVLATGGKDGRAKVWDVKKTRCVWTSSGQVGKLGAPDACVKVVPSMSKGVVVAGLKSGDIVLWSGFELSETEVGAIKAVKIPCPIPETTTDGIPDPPPAILSIHVDATASSTIALLVAYKAHTSFYRILIDGASVLVTEFCDPDSLGSPITSILPFFSSSPGESSFIITGDRLGCVCIYLWSIPSDHTECISPEKKLEAHADGSAVTALAWNGVTLLTGSNRGFTTVFDAFTFERLRTLDPPFTRGERRTIAAVADEVDRENAEAVRQILLSAERDVVVVSVGDRAMAWKAGVLPKNGMKVKHVGKKRERGVGNTKGYAQFDLKKTVNESLHQLDRESKHLQKVYGREREQRDNLEKLGLDEIEAVEYVLMLSREEALEQERAAALALSSHLANLDDGVFEGDFDDFIVSADRVSYASTSTAFRSGHSSPPHVESSARSNISTSPQTPGRPIPRASGSTSNNKVQVSPRHREEAREAGFGYSSGSLSFGASGHNGDSDEAEFPSISGSPSPRSWNGAGVPSPSARRQEQRGATSKMGKGKGPLAASPSSVSSQGVSAWNTPLMSRSPGDVSTPPVTPAPYGDAPKNTRSEVDEDEDLRLAIELSLIEAREAQWLD